jgi:CheY-like chemotaxis protein
LRQQKIIDVLLIEDDLDDQFLLKRSLTQSGLELRVQVVESAQQAEDYLLGHAPYDQRELYPFPDLLLCDLVMPLRTGLDLLNWIREHLRFAQLRVLPISGTIAPEEIEAAGELGTCGLFDKSKAVADPQALGRAISACLLRAVKA